MSSVYSTLFAPENIDAICFDMDGVLADLMGYDTWLEDLENHSTVPYAQAAPLLDTNYLNELLQCLWDTDAVPTYIISWGSKSAPDWMYEEKTKRAKIQWLSKFLPVIPDENIFIVPYGTPKSSLVQDFVSNPILFDDTIENIDAWNWNNAVAIDPSYSGDTIIPTLEDILYVKEQKHGIR